MQCGFANAFFTAVNALNEARKSPQDYGGGHPLHQSEINFLRLVRDHPARRSGDLSALWGVTDGAVTQAGSRLVEKGMVERYTLPGNRKEKYYALTASGELSLKGYDHLHREANRKLCEHIRSLDTEKAEAILEFLHLLGGLMPISSFSCKDLEMDACQFSNGHQTCNGLK